MGVAAELEVDSGLLGLLEVVGLMVEKDGEAVRGTGKFGNGFTPGIAPVVPADDFNPLETGHGVPQERDSRLGEELCCIALPADVLVIAQHGIYRSLDTAQFFRIITFKQRPDLHIDHIPAE